MHIGPLLSVLAAAAAAVDHDLLARCAVRLLNASGPASPATAVYVTISPDVSHEFRTRLLGAVHRAHEPALLLNRFHVDPFDPNRCAPPRAYLVAARGVPDLVDHLDTINVTDESWRPAVDFVFALETPPPPDDAAGRALEPVYRRILTNYAFRSVVLAPSTAADRGAVVAFAWYPFRRRCGEYHTPNVIDTCVRRLRPEGGGGGGGDTVGWNAIRDAFGGRIPRTFNGCTVTVAAFEWPPMTVLSGRAFRGGMDVGVVELMGRIGRVRLSVKPVARDRRWGVKSANGTWDGGFGELAGHRADLLIGGAILTAGRVAMFDSAPPRQVIRFPIYTPPPRRLPYWRNTLDVFSGRFWFTLLAVWALTAAVLRAAAAHLPSERRAFADAGHCLIVSWAVLCSVAAGRPPASVSSKMVYLSWVIYALHISAVYTSVQLAYVYRPKYERPMRTIGDVRASGLTVCCVPTFIPIARDMSPENFGLTEYTPCTDMLESARRLLRHKDIIILDPEDHFETLVAGDAKVNKAEEVVIVYNIGIYMQKGNPYGGALARAQITAYETGLHNKWRQDASPPSRSRQREAGVKVKKLNVDQLQGAFIVLLSGLCAGLLAFVVELVLPAGDRAEPQTACGLTFRRPRATKKLPTV